MSVWATSQPIKRNLSTGNNWSMRSTSEGVLSPRGPVSANSLQRSVSSTVRCMEMNGKHCGVRAHSFHSHYMSCQLIRPTPSSALLCHQCLQSLARWTAAGSTISNRSITMSRAPSSVTCRVWELLEDKTLFSASSKWAALRSVSHQGAEWAQRCSELWLVGGAVQQMWLFA